MRPCGAGFAALLPTTLALMCLALSLDAGEAAAQSRQRVDGSVRDVAVEAGVSEALIRLFTGESSRPFRQAVSDDDGRFRMEGVAAGPYRIEVVAFGYHSVHEMIEIPDEHPVDLRIDLAPDALELDPVVVAVAGRSSLRRSGFHDRRDRVSGTHLTRDEFLQRAGSVVSDVFRTIPGARVVPVEGLSHGGHVLLRGGCRPAVYIDGFEVAPGLALDQYLTVAEIEAMEIYRGPTAPAQFSSSGGCGSIVVWTREPQPSDRPFGWRRLAIAAGFVIASLFMTR